MEERGEIGQVKLLLLMPAFICCQDLSAQVSVETDPVTLLPKVVSLLYIQIHNNGLQAPRRAISIVVSRLKVSWYWYLLLGFVIVEGNYLCISILLVFLPLRGI